MQESKVSIMWTKLTPLVCYNPNSTLDFIFPTEDMKEDCEAKGVYLAGFESTQKQGENNSFNFILSNGVTSTF